MAPLPSSPDRRPSAIGARRPAPGTPSAEELIGRVRAVSGAADGLVALLDARGVAGERHLLSAWAHLGRSRQRGIERLRDRSAEFLLYVAGEPQLPRALARVGIAADTESFVAVAEPPRTATDLVGELGLVVDPEAYPRPVTEAVLDRLGIDATERSSVPPALWERLVLERVALVDLSAPPPSRRPSDR